uniref:ATP synthase gamma subunit n=1 Tax=Carsonella ruddii TaxID=114186 RepID=Q93U71_CARRU|nr:ATP synthase gamma subunit [Candidatus Carsonella ruddii]
MNIRNIKYKINILFNVNKLTNTMSMISFSKMNKFNKNINILNNLYLETKKIIFEIYNLKKNNYFCCILITTNKGFCGSINNESIRFLLKFLKNNKNLDIILIGKKSIDFFNKKNINIKKKFLFNEKINIIFDLNTLNFIKKYKNVFFISNKNINNNIKLIKTDLFFNKKKNFFEKKNINFDNLINKYINITLKYLYNENYFCELKLRMITMKAAADNSKKIIKNMNLIKNKIRQFKVTQEMLEIINSSNL